MARIQVVLVVAACFLGTSPLPAQTTRPATTQPHAPERVEPIRKLLIQLAADDAAEREAARIELMGLPRADLAALREAVRRTRPLEPAQTALLYDIVTHVFLAGDDYPAETSGFLGIRLPSDINYDELPLLAVERGVVVVSRIPGFCAYRMLQDGDIILSVAEPNASPVELDDPGKLIAVIKAIRPGQVITFEIARQGRIIKTQIKLDGRPLNLNNQNEFVNERQRTADEVWQKDFAPLLQEKLI